MMLFPGQFKIQQYQILYITKAECIHPSEDVISVIVTYYHDIGVRVNGLRAGGIHSWEKCHRPQGLIDNTVLLMVMRTRHSSAFSGMTERDSARGGGGNMKITKKI